MFDSKWLHKKIEEYPEFKTAFIHRSYLNETKGQKESNERLEFLGDSVLSFIISSYLYDLRPSDAEGDLTNLRSFIVKTQSLARASQKLDLGSSLKMSKGEELSGGRTNSQILANTYEALIGATFLTEGVDTTRELIYETLLPFFEEELVSGPPKDAKSQLQEYTQNSIKQSPQYKILETKGPDHAKQFRVGVFIQGKQEGIGEGNSKQIAEEAAAEEALKSFPKG